MTLTNKVVAVVGVVAAVGVTARVLVAEHDRRVAAEALADARAAALDSATSSYQLATLALKDSIAGLELVLREEEARTAAATQSYRSAAGQVSALRAYVDSTGQLASASQPLQELVAAQDSTIAACDAALSGCGEEAATLRGLAALERERANAADSLLAQTRAAFDVERTLRQGRVSFKCGVGGSVGWGAVVNGGGVQTGPGVAAGLSCTWWPF